MEKTLKLLLSYLAKIHQKKENEIAEMLFEGDINEGNVKDDALNTLVAMEEARTIKLKAGKTQIKAAEAAERTKVLTEIQDQLKTTFPDFESEHEISSPDFFKELSEALSKKNQAPDGEITEDAWKKSKFYSDLKSQHGIELKKVEKQWKDKLELREAEITKKETFDSVRGIALKEFKALNPVLPEDGKLADRHVEKLFLSEVYNGFDYRIEGEGDERKIIPLDKTGKPLEDNLGNLIDFKTHIKQIADQNFTFAAADPKGAAGDPTKGNGNGAAAGANGKSKKFQSYALKKPASDADWMKVHEQIENDKELPTAEKTELQLALKNLHVADAVTK